MPSGTVAPTTTRSLNDRVRFAFRRLISNVPSRGAPLFVSVRSSTRRRPAAGLRFFADLTLPASSNAPPWATLYGTAATLLTVILAFFFAPIAVAGMERKARTAPPRATRLPMCMWFYPLRRPLPRAARTIAAG